MLGEPLGALARHSQLTPQRIPPLPGATGQHPTHRANHEVHFPHRPATCPLAGGQRTPPRPIPDRAIVPTGKPSTNQCQLPKQPLWHLLQQRSRACRRWLPSPHSDPPSPSPLKLLSATTPKDLGCRPPAAGHDPRPIRLDSHELRDPLGIDRSSFKQLGPGPGPLYLPKQKAPGLRTLGT